MTLERMILSCVAIKSLEIPPLELNQTNTYHKNAGFSSLEYAVGVMLERLSRTWEWEAKPWFGKENL
jgi:hypothetical protein